MDRKLLIIEEMNLTRRSVAASHAVCRRPTDRPMNEVAITSRIVTTIGRKAGQVALNVEKRVSMLGRTAWMQDILAGIR